MIAQILPDGTEDGVEIWGIVCDQPFTNNLYCGHLRRKDQLHSGKFVYPFSTLKSAEGALAEMQGREA